MTLNPEQRQLFIRIMRLTLFRGIIVGIIGILTCLWVYNFIMEGFLGGAPVPFHFEGLLGSLYIMLCGAMAILQVEVTHLSSQFLVLPQPRKRQ